MDGGAWYATVHGIAKSQTPVSNFTFFLSFFAAPWTVAHQAALSMGFSRQEHWGGLPFPSPGDLPNLGIKLRSPALPADALTSEPPGKVVDNLDTSSLFKLLPL